MGNFLSGLVHIYRPVKGYNPTVNRSRLFNSYESLMDVIACIVNYSVFKVTNQMMMSHLFLVETLIGIIGNYIVHISLAMRFIYSVVLNAIASILIIIFGIQLLTRYSNLMKVCNLLEKYHKAHPEKSQDVITVCETQKQYYLFWIGMQVLVVLFKQLSIFFAFKAHNFVKNKKMWKKRN